ncbi:hypothetical protein NDU88_008555 [Pleurodeles waltl]|uniref:Uncharacterized protein n=1 Tax=Pleurodeles waltl TaxID=8319 RepID=A0AAV7QUY2_PLEWA|nr:hypothetical protein NDU88_008555 [Pleurodeles waltl]
MTLWSRPHPDHPPVVPRSPSSSPRHAFAPGRSAYLQAAPATYLLLLLAFASVGNPLRGYWLGAKDVTTSTLDDGASGTDGVNTDARWIPTFYFAECGFACLPSSAGVIFSFKACVFDINEFSINAMFGVQAEV